MKKLLLAVGCWLMTVSAGAQIVDADSAIYYMLKDYGVQFTSDNIVALRM